MQQTTFCPSVRFRAFRCFDKNCFEGFDEIAALNILIGRNNSGKSAALQMIDFATKVKSDQNALPADSAVMVDNLLGEDLVRSHFPEGAQGGGYTGESYWAFAKNLVGQRMSVVFQTQTPPEIFDLPQQYEQYRKDEAFTKLAHAFSGPLQGRWVARLAAERDIKPEPDNGLLLKEDGTGATSSIQAIQNKVKYDQTMISHKLLTEMNTILTPDIRFDSLVARQHDNGSWEVFLEEVLKGRIRLSESGSGLKTIILLLLEMVVLPAAEKRAISNHIFLIEEPENNLHPAIQRNIVHYVHRIAVDTGAIVFLSTHSSTIIDAANRLDNTNLYHVQNKGKKTTIRKVTSMSGRSKILDDLGFRASDLLQANGIVWVEGPSDRIYIMDWIKKGSNGNLLEGFHYQILFYGGRLLSHLEVSRDLCEQEELINILFTNRKAFMVIDSDKEAPDSQLTSTKQRISKAAQDAGVSCWITQGREIENYIPKEAISRVLAVSPPIHIGQFEKMEQYLDTCSAGLSDKFLADKVGFAESITESTQIADFANRLDFKARLDHLVADITTWNQPPEQSPESDSSP